MVIEAKLPTQDLSLEIKPLPEDTPKPPPHPVGQAARKVFKGGKLKNEIVDALKMQYGMWLGLPLDCRQDDEKTMSLFGKKLGVTETTLTAWKGDALVQETATNALKILGGNRKLAIINKIMDQALAGEYQQQRIYMEWQGEVGAGAAKDKESRKPRSMELILTTDTPKDSA